MNSVFAYARLGLSARLGLAAVLVGLIWVAALSVVV
jgi:hypothetical protein